MIEIKELSVDLGDFKIEEINLEIQEGEYFGLLGPTGSGKTQLIKCLAGIQKADEGTISINGEDVTKLPPERRKIGYTPQDYKLFPHLTVKENVMFGLDGKDSDPKKVANELMKLVEISHLSERQCTKCLSGGERQRVALARALAIKPRLLLLDEPLGALDAQTNKRLRGVLKRIHRETQTTTIHITHNFEEILDLADRIAIMRDGKIVQVGEPQKICKEPDSEFVTEFTEGVLAAEH